jgi:hypothetical protein
MSGVSYAMVVSGANAKMETADLERSDAEIVDVTFSWGTSGDRTVLDVKHLAVGQALSVGEGDGCDLLVPKSALGALRAELVRYEGTTCFVAVPSGASARLDGFPTNDASLPLSLGHVAEIDIGGFALRFTVVAAPKKVVGAGVASALRNGGLRSVLGSAFVHGLAIAAVAFFMPSLSSAEQDEIDRDHMVDIQKLLNASADKELEKQIDDSSSAGGADSLPGDRAKGPEGQAGKPEAKAQGRMALKGDKDREKSFSREQERQAAMDFGFIGYLATQTANDGPNVPWGSVQNGPDAKSVMGSLFGQSIGEAPGFGGLGLTGPGSGGGGNNPWIGMNGIGGLGGTGGPGHCTGPSCPGNIGVGKGGNGGGYAPKPFTMRPEGQVRVNGRLDPQIIQRIIQQNWGRYRFCYEAGLRNNPTLAGHVGVKFIIDRTGAVAMAMDSGSSLPDSSVNQCVARSFTALSFPAPEGGQVTVQYGFYFSPS